MGASTLAEIVTEGLLQAGNTSLTARAKTHLKKWLRTQAQNFQWPVTKNQDSIDLVAGDESFSIGNGSGGVTQEIQRVLDPMKIFSTDGGDTLNGLSVIRVVTDWDDNTDAPSDGRGPGKPTQARVSKTATKGEWEISFNYELDQDYTVAFEFYGVPVDPADGAVPWYPNDQTMIHVVYAWALRQMKNMKEAAEADNEVRRMLGQDKLGNIDKDGINDNGIPLKSGVFR